MHGHGLISQALGDVEGHVHRGIYTRPPLRTSFLYIKYVLVCSKILTRPWHVCRFSPAQKDPSSSHVCFSASLFQKVEKSPKQKTIYTRPLLLCLFITHWISFVLLKSSCPTRHVWRFLFCPKISTDIRCVLFCPPASKDPKDMKQKRMFDTLFSTQLWACLEIYGIYILSKNSRTPLYVCFSVSLFRKSKISRAQEDIENSLFCLHTNTLDIYGIFLLSKNDCAHMIMCGVSSLSREFAIHKTQNIYSIEKCSSGFFCGTQK